MIRQTSLEAYESIDLGKNQLIVYNALKILREATMKEVGRYLAWEINCVTPRMKELSDMGMIKIIGEKRQKNNRLALVWGII
jgi:hypothetical protein